MAAALSHRYLFPNTQCPGEQPWASRVHANKRTYWVEPHSNLTYIRQRTATSPWKRGQRNHVNLLQMGISPRAVGRLRWREISVRNVSVFRAVGQCHCRPPRCWDPWCCTRAVTSRQRGGRAETPRCASRAGWVSSLHRCPVLRPGSGSCPSSDVSARQATCRTAVTGIPGQRAAGRTSHPLCLSPGSGVPPGL